MVSFLVPLVFQYKFFKLQYGGKQWGRVFRLTVLRAVENFSGIPKNISMFIGIPFSLKLILYQNICHFMPFLFMFIQSPSFLGNPRLTPGARFARPAEIMETEPVGGHSCVKPFWPLVFWVRWSNTDTVIFLRQRKKNMIEMHTVDTIVREK